MSKSESASIKDAVHQSVNKFFSPDAHFIIGVSGGPDSMALMYLFSKLSLKATVVHINYALRGKDSDLDQELVEGMAFEWGYDCYSIKPDKELLAEGNFQNAAREERYRIFRELKEELKAKAIVIAHHRDDQIETIFQKLMRGSGIAAWKGMQELEEDLFRPLLSFSKKEVLEYCRIEHIPYRQDASNLESDYARNFFRNELHDELNRLYPGWEQNMLSLPDQAQLCREALETLVALNSDGNRLSLSSLRNYSSSLRRALIKSFLENRGVEGISRGQLGELNTADQWQTGQGIKLSDGIELVRDREFLVVKVLESTFEPLKISQKDLETGIQSEHVELRYHNTIDHSGGISFDANEVHFPLELRRWQDGDRFRPLGMKGSQLVSDHLTNRKVSAANKRKALVLCGADSTIYAIIYPEQLPDGRMGIISERVRYTQKTSVYVTIKAIKVP